MIRGLVTRFAAGLRFPTLFGLVAGLFVLDFVIPDLIPFADEILLGFGTVMLGSLRRRRGGAAQLWRMLRGEQQKLIGEGKGHRIHLTKTGCLGPCRFSPVIQIYPQGTVYGPMEPEDLTRVIESHLRRDQPVEALVVHEAEPARTAWTRRTP